MPAQDSVCISYARVSSGQQRREGAGLQRQLQMAQEYANAHQLQLDDRLTFQDAGKSGSKGDHIAKGGALGQILEAIKGEQLGPSPTLLVEDVSRLSRLELMDGLDKVLFPLIRSGCRIVLLEDGSVFDEARINSDSTAMILLCLKFQAAADYAKKRSQYARKTRAKNRQQILDGQAVCAGWAPSWIELREGKWRFNDYAPTVQRLIELMWSDGTQVTAKKLNLEGHRSPMGGTWTQSSVRRLLDNPALYGTRRIAKPGHVEAIKAWKAARAQWAEGDQKDHPPARPEPTYELVKDVFPAVMSRKDYDSLLAVIQRRARNPKERGRRDQIRYVGQMATRCVCGAAIGTRYVKSGGKHLGYLFCRGRERGETDCKRKPIRIEPVTANLLTRLKGEYLKTLVGNGEADAEHRATALRTQEQLLQNRLAGDEDQLQNAANALKERAKAGRAVAVFEAAWEEAQTAVDATKQEIAAVRAELTSISSPNVVSDLDEAVRELLKVFARNESTPDQRRAVNKLIQQLDIQITLDTDLQVLGMSVGDGRPEWQPLNRKLDLAALRSGTIQTISDDWQIDQETLDLMLTYLPRNKDGLIDLRPVMKALGIDDGSQEAWLDPNPHKR